MISKRLLPLLHLALMTSAMVSPAIASKGSDSQHSLSVELVGTGTVLQFAQPTRLESILKNAKEQKFILQYPLAVTLFDNSKKARRESVSLKNAVLNQMIQHNLVAHPFYKFIKKSQFAPRVLSAVDIDQVRLDRFANPLLNGELALSAPTRQAAVFYVGNIDKVYTIENQAGVSLETQIERLQIDPIGHFEHAPILIYPDGNVIQPHHGSWLTKQYYLPPLTLVYIPFDEFENSPMDQDIVNLLSQRKPTLPKN